MNTAETSAAEIKKQGDLSLEYHDVRGLEVKVLSGTELEINIPIDTEFNQGQAYENLASGPYDPATINYDGYGNALLRLKLPQKLLKKRRKYSADVRVEKERAKGDDDRTRTTLDIDVWDKAKNEIPVNCKVGITPNGRIEVSWGSSTVERFISKVEDLRLYTAVAVLGVVISALGAISISRNADAKERIDTWIKLQNCLEDKADEPSGGQNNKLQLEQPQ